MDGWTGTPRSGGLDRAVIGRRLRGVSAFVVVGMVLAACSSSGATGSPATVVGGATATPVAAKSSPPVAAKSAVPRATPDKSLATGVPTTLDPCKLLTSEDAGKLAGGVAYGAGKEGTTSGNGKTCVYGANTANVFTVIVAQSPDVATAKAGKAAAEAELQAQAGNAAKFIELPTFADGAAYYSGSLTFQGVTIHAGAIYVLKGTIFFGFSILSTEHAEPSAAALEAQATTFISRLPAS